MLRDNGISVDTEDFVLLIDYDRIFKVIGEIIVEIIVYVLDHEGRKLERIVFDLKKIKKNLEVVKKQPLEQ